jgi:hypothetical protein
MYFKSHHYRIAIALSCTDSPLRVVVGIYTNLNLLTMSERTKEVLLFIGAVLFSVAITIMWITIGAIL